MSYVLITGRYGDGKMEIINADSSTTVCRDKYNYPIDIRGSTGVVINESIIVCGGEIKTSPFQKTNKCYLFGHEKEWKLIANMTTPRYGAASVPLEDALWIGGGEDKFGHLNSTELVFLNGNQTSRKTPLLPEKRSSSCAAEINGKIFFTGGYGNGAKWNNTWIINSNDDFKVTNGPYMLKKRYAHSCGIFKSHAHSGRPVLVTAGSGKFGTVSSKYMDQRFIYTCEFWDFTLLGTTWQLCSKSLSK